MNFTDMQCDLSTRDGQYVVTLKVLGVPTMEDAEAIARRLKEMIDAHFEGAFTEHQADAVN